MALNRLLEQQPRGKNYAHLLTASIAFPDLMNDPAVRKQMTDAINDPDRDVQRAAIEIALNRLEEPSQSALPAEIFGQLGSSQRSVLIEEVSDPKFLRKRGGVSGGALSQDGGAYANGAKTANPTVQAIGRPDGSEGRACESHRFRSQRAPAALDLLRRSPGIEERADFRAAVERMQNDPNFRLRNDYQRMYWRERS